MQKNARLNKLQPILKFLTLAMAMMICRPTTVLGFPELIRHGYVNCSNCHISPSGGGTINDYGRNFVAEGLSSWSYKGEESFLHGAVERSQIPKWLSIGGDVRALQLWVEDPNTQTARSIMMQADVEAAVKYDKWKFDLSFGRFQRSAEEPRPKSRRFFAMYNFTDEIGVRAGRFTPAYGINLADHFVATRSPLGFDQSNETYNVEFSWLTDVWSVLLTAVNGPVDAPNTQQEKAGALQVGYAFHDTYKVGASYWQGSSDTRNRSMAGLYAMLGFSPELYYLGEFDIKWSTPTGLSEQQTTYSYQRLGYEFKRGAHLIATCEAWQADAMTFTVNNDRYGAGVDLFPRPHFEIEALWLKWRSGDIPVDYAYALAHYYF
jgi:hypothetical protein